MAGPQSPLVASGTDVATRPVGLNVRAVIHAGEIERRDDDIGGIAVHIAARVGAHARAGGPRLEHRARPRGRLRHGFEDEGQILSRGYPSRCACSLS
jgi:class 3 adenylate cyclase